MATLYLSPITMIVQYFSNLGIIAQGAKVYTYLAGTVSTPQTTYTDSTGILTNMNPLVVNAAGRPAAPSGAPVAFWAPKGVALKLLVTDSAGNVLVGPIDNIGSINDSSSFLAPLSQSGNGQGVDLVANAVRSYDIFASLRADPAPVPVSGQTVLAIVMGAKAIADDLGGIFYWAPTSTNIDDGADSITPNNAQATGRWLRLVYTNRWPGKVVNQNYTFTASDVGLSLLHTDANPYQFNIPTNASVPLPDGAEFLVINISAAPITIAGAVPPSVYSYSNSGTGGVVVGQYQSVRLIKFDTDSWIALDPTPLNYLTGNFDAVLGGVSPAADGFIKYKVIGNRVSLWLQGPAITGTSNATGFAFTGLPAALQPSAQRLVPCILEDNGVVTGGWASFSASGTVNFGLGFANNASGFTNTGTKGIPLGFQVAYDL